MCVCVCRTVPVVSTGQAPCVVLPLKYEPVDATAFLIHDDSKCVLSTISRSFCFHGGVCTGSRTSALASPALLVSAPHDRIAQTRPHSSWPWRPTGGRSCQRLKPVLHSHMTHASLFSPNKDGVRRTLLFARRSAGAPTLKPVQVRRELAAQRPRKCTWARLLKFTRMSS